MTRSLCFVLLCSTALLSCELNRGEEVRRPGWGYVPRYLPADSAFLVRALPPQDFVDAGSFALLGDLLFIVDRGLGFHIVDNGDPSAPVNISFVSVPGCTGVTARDQFVYVNNLTDLVTLDVSDPGEPTQVDRVEDLYAPLPDYPDDPLSTFECLDPGGGTLVGWTLDELGPDEELCRLN